MSQKFWMSLEQAEQPEEFAKNIPGEFTSSPIREGAEKEGLERRDFMKIMGASALMASLAGCTKRPVQKIVPYVTNPEEIIPGVPNFYASADPQTGYGLIVRTREGRPIKVDGNTDHPMNKGALHTRAQAMIHDLYDPDRLRAPRIGGAEVNWNDFDTQVKQVLANAKGATWLLTGTVMSPTLKRVIAAGDYQHVMVDAECMDDVIEGQAQSYGRRVFPRYRFDRADVVVSLGADFLGNWGSPAEYTKQFSERRRLNSGKDSMSKLVVFESAYSTTGQSSDQRFAIHPSDQLPVALGLLYEVNRLTGGAVGGLGDYSPSAVSQKTGVSAEAITGAAKDLVKARGRALVVASGRGQAGTALQAVVNSLNQALGADGKTVDGSNFPSNQFQGSLAQFGKLLAAMKAGQVKALIIQGVNPGYLFGDAGGVKDAIQKVPSVIYVGSYADETAALAKYLAAESHSFEAWGDVNPQRDLYSIQQPTIRPLWQTRSLLEDLVAWSNAGGGKPVAESAYAAVTETWKDLHKKYGGARSFQDWWDDTLMGGLVDGAASARKDDFGGASLSGDAIASAVAFARTQTAKGTDLALVLGCSVGMGEGCQSNNAILQELPDPISKNTWGNYLAVAPETAQKNGWIDGDHVSVEANGASVTLPMYRQPGLHPGVVMSYRGYGRKFNGRIGNDVGVSFANVAGVMAGGAPAFVVPAVKIAKTGGKEKIACTQGHHTLEGRDIVFETSLEEFRENPKAGILEHFGGNPPSIWSGFEYKGYKWGMAIDLSKCTGCSACVVACSVENNVPAVGKQQVQKGREMQWIRIDRYYTGDSANPEVVTQPMLCQHCENAPCETVCPVLATTHSDEGLNQMTYNRCVGTKYCSNNCPYKVRRFNWFNNQGDMNGTQEHPIPMRHNPEVTLRSRGVMEKCTFCVQRIESGKSAAKTQGRRAGDDDIRTACQEACPADVIVFGDLNNPDSAISKLAKHPRGFTSLEEVNARPRVTYLTKVRNRPAPAGASKGHHGGGQKEGHAADHGHEG